MISNFKQVEELLEEIDKKLKEKVDIYVIGGAVLLSRGLKTFTKDIDIIVKTDKERISLESTLRELGFQGEKITKEYRNLEITYILKRGEFRIDLFTKRVCSALSISEGIEKRAEKIKAYDNLNVFLCSNEDILLFKAIARRDADIEDCIALAKQPFDWKILIQEINEQIKQGKEIWITYLAESLQKLEEKDINIPIMEEILELYKNYMEKIAKE